MRRELPFAPHSLEIVRRELPFAPHSPRFASREGLLAEHSLAEKPREGQGMGREGSFSSCASQGMSRDLGGMPRELQGMSHSPFFASRFLGGMPHSLLVASRFLQGIPRKAWGKQAEIFYLVAIQSAERSIHIQNAYFVPDEQIREALIQAAKRGVDVKIMVPGRHIDMPLVRMASRSHYGELLQAGVHILEYNHTMMHQKNAVIDGLLSTIGSINFDGRSLRANEEDSLAFYDSGFAAQVEATFADDEKYSREITYQSWKKRGAEQHLAEVFSVFFEPLY
ncbi:MAG: hypothetical protein DMF53_16370 [Acidobacteria bacterium]|nr:MAG: hypothetical protein DMF53_16370 [Acidobacteriota bacterium]